MLALLTASAATLFPATPQHKPETKAAAVVRPALQRTVVHKTAIPARTTAKFAPAHPARLVRTTPVRAAALRTAAIAPRTGRVHAVATGPWRVPTYADSSLGDQFAADEPMVRRAALDALSSLNGSIVAADAETGRVLTIVNQKVAFRDGFEPCSTIKVPVALGALSEMVVERDTPVRLNRYTRVDMTTALAKSNNEYFAAMGERLGFDRVGYYTHMFGLGEKASLNIEEEQPGHLPLGIPRGGLGMMTSFGEGISQTPLQLAAEMVAVANGGTLFYLQYPRTLEEAQIFVPRVKRKLDVEPLIRDVLPGLKGAVQYGTARSIGVAANGEQIFGKTGTCTDERSPTHLGWFGSFMETPKGKIAVAVLLTGGRAVSGPTAAGIAGAFYRNLAMSGFFLGRVQQQTEASLIPGFPTPTALNVR